MTKDHRDGARNALNKFYQKQADELAPKQPVERVRNKAPEKDVERECLKWMRAREWKVEIYEAKAKWNSEAQRFTSTGMKFGTVDCMGSTDEGIAVAVEFKAPGALSTFNREERFLQRKFIVDRINSNAFACVVDSAARLETIYLRWKELRLVGLAEARQYLISALPQKTEKTRLKEEKLFDDE